MDSTPSIINECIEIAKKFSQQLTEANKRVGARKISPKLPKNQQRLGQLEAKYAEHLKKLGKKETISVTEIAELNNKNKMPTMIKHCVVAVMPQLKNESKDNAFIGAHNICVWSFKRHGLVNSKGMVSGRGGLREKYHKTKADENAGKKTQSYNKLFNKIFK